MASKFYEDTLRIVVAQLCQNIGFQGILSSSSDVLVDLLHRYLKDITISTHNYTEHYGRTVPNLDDLGLALQDMGVSVRELEEYVTHVEPISFPHKIPQLPISKPLNLNFLKPGAREILSRQLHIHEHLPPMYPEKEEEENLSNNVDDENIKEEDMHDAQLSPQEKRTIEEDHPVNKKLKIWTEDEGEPVREIDSVMMTTSGYISSAREGKMPESRRPLIPMSLPGGSSSVTKSSSSMIKKKATMEKIIRHKNHQGGILPGPLAKPKVKHVKLKPKIPLAPPGTGSLQKIRSPGGGQAPKLKIPNMNKEKEKEVNPIKKSSSEKDGERKKKDKKEGKDRKKRDKGESSTRKKKEDRREYKYHSYENRKERTRIRMRGLSKEEELRRYKERENELIAALAASSAVTVTSIPPPSLRVREKTPDKSSPESSSKNKLSIFKKFPKNFSKDGGSDSSSDLMIDAPVVKEEKISPPPSPRMDIPDMLEDINTSLPPTPRTPEIRHHFPALNEEPIISPHRIKKEKDLDRIPSKKKSPRGSKRRGSKSSGSPSWGGVSDFSNMNRSNTPEGVMGTGEGPEESSPLFSLPPFPHGPSLIPPPFSRFPFIPPFGAPTRPPIPDMNPMSHMFMDSPPILPVDKGMDIDNMVDRPPTPPLHESRTKSILPVTPLIPIHLETKPLAEKPVLSSPPKAQASQETLISQSSKPEKHEKEKKKEHKKEKKEKEKERLKKKKEKKEREKKEKEEKKKEKKEERERLKKERKEKKKNSSESVPKLTLKLATENEGEGSKISSENKVMPKLVIKPVLKHPVNEQHTSQPTEKHKKRKCTPPPFSPSPPRIPSPLPQLSLPPPPSPPLPSTSSVKSSIKVTHSEAPGSPPEIAKFSALVTRPPKGSHSKKNSELSVPPLKIKDGYKISSKKEFSSSMKSENRESTVPPLKIKNSSPMTINSPSVKFVDDKKTFHSKKSDKKEKRKTSPLIITSLSNIDTGNGSVPKVRSPSPPPPPPPQPVAPVPPAQLPPPILIPSEPPKSSKKLPSASSSSSATSGTTQNKSTSKTSGMPADNVGPIGHFVDDQGNEVWICPTCGKQDDGSPMIGCDTCDDWYHWVCVGIHVPPSERENWYCPRCLSQHKQQRGSLGVEKKKRGRKRKII